LIAQANAVGLWHNPTEIEQRVAVLLACGRADLDYPDARECFNHIEAHQQALEWLLPEGWEGIDASVFGGKLGC
jgi:hypothetical protein